MADTASGSGFFQWAALAIAPICTLAIGWFGWTQQGKLADKVEKALDERMKALDQKIDIVTGNLAKNVTELKADLTKSIDGLRGDLKTDVSEIRADIKALSTTATTVQTSVQSLISYLEKLIQTEVKAA